MKRLRLKNRFLVIGDIVICVLAYFLIFLLLYDKNDTFLNFFHSGSEVVITAIVFCVVMVLIVSAGLIVAYKLALLIPIGLIIILTEAFKELILAFVFRKIN